MITKENKQSIRPKPVMLIILDGFGIAPPSGANAITLANTPVLDRLIAEYPATTLQASGLAVGLPWGKMGNSEVGHMSIGAGRIIYQDLQLINQSISDGSFFKNKAFVKAINHVKENNSSLHLLGLVSNGGVHSSIEHLQALLEMAKRYKLEKVYIHAILDGRDTPFNSGLNFIKQIIDYANEINCGKIASLSGRFYAMDRDNHWERIKLAYDAIRFGKGNKFTDPLDAIRKSYEKKVYDEEMKPIVIIGSNNQPIATIKDKDAVIFFNFRSDRPRELTKTFVLPSFPKFDRGEYLRNLLFVTMTRYDESLPTEVAFLPDKPRQTLGKVISDYGLKQLRIAETEKYAHVTYFFNGGEEKKYPGEDTILVPSPRVGSYDQKPEMSAKIITEKVINEIMKDKYDFILLNFANPDMVGHTGNLKATIKAIEVVDSCLGEITSVIENKGGVAIIIADHGNAECLYDMQTGRINKEHTTNPVPFIVVGKDWRGKNIASFPDVTGGDLSIIKPQGILADVAPSILDIMKLKKPAEMKGISLIR